MVDFKITYGAKAEGGGKERDMEGWQERRDGGREIWGASSSLYLVHQASCTWLYSEAPINHSPSSSGSSVVSVKPSRLLFPWQFPFNCFMYGLCNQNFVLKNLHPSNALVTQ